MLSAEGCRDRRSKLLARLPHSGPLVLGDPLNLRYFAGFHVDPFSLGGDFGGALVIQPDGRTVRMIDLDRAALRKSPEELRREEEENLARLREQAPEMDEELLREAARPDSVWPLVEELAVDPSGRLWVRTRRSDTGDATTYDVFNEGGEYLVRVDVPGEVERTAFAPDGRLFTLVAARDGAGEIVGYRVSLGSPSSSGQPTSESGT